MVEVAFCANHRHGLIENGCFDHWLSFPLTIRLFHLFRNTSLEIHWFYQGKKIGRGFASQVINMSRHLLFVFWRGISYYFVFDCKYIKLPYGYQFSCSQRWLRTPWPWRWKNIEFVLAGFKHVKPLSQTSIWKTEHCYWRWSLVRSWHKWKSLFSSGFTWNT